ncbi:PREDICTED: cystatin-B-like [Branchiostoma belcheri]|uniref:Cystatin-B-like n=1 Tax=Branchiostoma belcheri TaxID=7741 RepID=A0A6P5ANS3_BRABE|nr:PREDICTED: cystatin-B-like [Branchiostoma belcheri]
MPICGGAKEPEAATEEIQAICDEVKAEVEEQAGVKYETFRATTFSSQVVAGTNYFIKVDVGGEKFVHLRVFKGLPHAPGLKVSAVQLDKGKEDPIGYF